MANNVQLRATEKQVTARKLKRFKLICLGVQGTTEKQVTARKLKRFKLICLGVQGTTEKEVTARKLKRFKLICLGAQGTTCINILLWLGGNLHIPILL